MARAALRIPTPRLRLVPPRLPRPLDADDTRILARIMVYTLLAFWIVAGVALAAGLAVRLFAWAAWGGF